GTRIRGLHVRGIPEVEEDTGNEQHHKRDTRGHRATQLVSFHALPSRNKAPACTNAMDPYPADRHGSLVRSSLRSGSDACPPPTGASRAKPTLCLIPVGRRHPFRARRRAVAVQDDSSSMLATRG